MSGARALPEKEDRVNITPEVLEDASETLSPLGEKLAPFIFVLFLAGMVYLAYRDLMLPIRAFGFLGVAVGLFAALFAARSIARARKSTAWPVVQGIVTRSEVFTRSSTSVGRGQAVSMTVQEYYPAVCYEYDVEGQRYRSKRIIFFPTNYTRADAEAAVARYTVGQPVTAYYNPAKPQIAVLEPGLGPNAGHYYKGYVIGAMFVVVGLLLAYGIPWAVARFG